MPTDLLLISELRIPTVRLLEQILTRVSEDNGYTFRSKTLDELSLRDLTPDTVPLFARVDRRAAYRLMHQMQRLGIGFWYYLDDNFWEINPETELGKYYSEPSVRQRLEYSLSHADRVLVSTPALREYLSRFGDHLTQMDSFFDFSLIPELPPAAVGRPTVRAGFATSADRLVDVLPVVPDLLAALDRHPTLEFELIAPETDEIPDHPRIRRFPVLDGYEAYVRFQLERQWDFAIAPLSGARSNHYKTDNKYREYAAFGIPGIYQESLPYSAVRDGETGLIVGEGRRSWLDAFTAYTTDPVLRGEVRVNARADVEERRSIDAVSASWSREIAQAPRIGPDAEKLRRAIAVRITLVLARTAVSTMFRHGPGEFVERTSRYLRKRRRRAADRREVGTTSDGR